VAIRCAGNRIFAHTAITPVARAAVRCCSTWPFLAQSRSFSQLAGRLSPGWMAACMRGAVNSEAGYETYFFLSIR
jgi:hypothetical protein